MAAPYDKGRTPSRVADMDWTCPAVVDCVWQRLLELEWLTRHDELGHDSATQMWACLTSLCRATWRDPFELCRCIDRPYLAVMRPHIAPHEHGAMVRADFALRRFFTHVQRLAALTGVDVVCAGGYPAWRLERHMDTTRGGDALPRSVRSTTIGLSSDLHEYWIPHNIDLFTTEGDADAIALLLEEAYVLYVCHIARSYSSHGCVFVRGAHGRDSPVTASEDRDLEIESCVRHVEEHFPASHSIRADVCRHLRQSRELRPTTVTMRKLWTCMSSLRMEFEPSIVTVWHVARPDGPVGPLRNALPSLLPLSHVGVQLSVVDGMWQYRATAEALSDLTHRRLRIMNTHCYPELLRGLHRYLVRGFSLSDVPSPTAVIVPPSDAITVVDAPGSARRAEE